MFYLVFLAKYNINSKPHSWPISWTYNLKYEPLTHIIENNIGVDVKSLVAIVVNFMFKSNVSNIEAISSVLAISYGKQIQRVQRWLHLQHIKHPKAMVAVQVLALV